MKNMITAAAIAAVTATAAHADSLGTFDMKYVGGGLLKGGLDYQAVDTDSSVNTAGVAGELRHTTRNRTGAANDLPVTFSSFCIELQQHTSGDWNDFQVRSLLEAPNPDRNGPGDTGYGQQIQMRVHAVVRAAIDQGLINDRLQPTDNANRGNMAAVQLSIWEAIWELNGDLDLADGTSRLDNHNFERNNAMNDAFNGIMNQANSLLALGRNDFNSYKVAGLVALTSSGAQDQLAIVPLPPAAFAGLGLLGAAGVVRRLRK